MHAKHWTTLLFAGCLSVGGTARGQIAPPAPPQRLDDTQDVLIQPLPPGAPAAPGEDPLQAPIPVPPLPLKLAIWPLTTIVPEPPSVSVRLAVDTSDK